MTFLGGVAVAASRGVNSERKTLLVVDDEVEVAKSLRRLLRKEFEVALAHTGAEALERLAQSPVDLVLSDFRMPGMSGTELLAEVKLRNPATLRVLLSGYADLESAPNRDDTIHFVRKPWDDHALVTLLRALTSGARIEANR